MGDLQIDLARGDSVSLVGRLDARTAAAARAALHDVVDSGRGELLVELGGLEIWDRAGLGVVVGLARRAAGRGRTLVLLNPGPREARLLRVAGVGRMARMTASVPEADEARLLA
ncbi:STAS domain-containing protein [Spongisporangium articulatum]|uniref:STAS domain-containing protein n=1 Tax=Spongisporangium articulatum TaxID=3362603 RepID=A0ABW8AVL8_9ACTN